MVGDAVPPAPKLVGIGANIPDVSAHLVLDAAAFCFAHIEGHRAIAPTPVHHIDNALPRGRSQALFDRLNHERIKRRMPAQLREGTDGHRFYAQIGLSKERSRAMVY